MSATAKAVGDIVAGRRVSVVHITGVRMPRPHGAGEVGLRVEACTSWAPSTDHDAKTHTDVWCGNRKITVALPFDEVDRVLAQARGEEETP